MIIIEAGKRDTRSFDAKILFATQLARRNHKVVIDEKTLPDEIDRGQKYEVAPFLADISDCNITGFILIGAEDISAETLSSLHSYGLDGDVTVSATGRFSDYQSLVGASSKLAFALGREANVIDLNEIQKQQILRTSITPLTACSTVRVASNSEMPELFLFVPPEYLEEPMVLPVLGAMDHVSGYHLNVITSGVGKEIIRKSIHSSISVFGLSELAPDTFAKMADVAAFLGDSVPGERMAIFALDLLKSGGTIIDCTHSATFVTSGAPALRGPEELAVLPNYLEKSVLPNLAEISQQTRDSDWLDANSIERLEIALGLSETKISTRKTRALKTLFVPTNGNGLGHAQRCSLISSAMKSSDHVSYAAFPSCVNLVQSKGYDCTPLVQKSGVHVEEFANDIVNYLRLKRTVYTGDKIVFDGGYVFDSIYRTIIEKSLSATWIRRGLWRAGQIKNSAFDRENVFDNVIVPNEAFEELNANYTFGQKVRNVGPIVHRSSLDQTRKTALTEKLKSALSSNFDELVVTMLGGGLAADRSAQMQTLCSMLERRPDCLHLIVAWPGSNISASLSGWENTRVVKSINAVELCQVADLVVSAAGYNSFHEILYHGVPAIFIPQVAPFMDDQEKRARAASDRGLAATVLGHEFLLLEREVNTFLDGGKSQQVKELLTQQHLPPTGNEAAARIIEGERSNDF